MVMETCSSLQRFFYTSVEGSVDFIKLQGKVEKRMDKAALFCGSLFVIGSRYLLEDNFAGTQRRAQALEKTYLF